MPSFLNINLDGKINFNFFLKHLLFSTFWILGIFIFLFRIDVIIVDNYFPSLQWVKTILPTVYFVSLFISLWFLKWYYILAFFCYPFLFIFWFLPKTILRKGKIYLLGNYLSSIIRRLSNLKLTIIHIFLLLLSLIIFLTISQDWTRCLAICILTYFYSRYVYRLLKKSFRTPALFNHDIQKEIRIRIQKNNSEDSLIVKSIILRDSDEKLEPDKRKEKIIRRSILANYALEEITSKLNSFKGKKAFLISWIFEAFMFLSYSIIFFWFLNFQLYKLSPSNFNYTGSFPIFDFLYYTLKTITFGDINIVKPISILARISEILSFLILGIFLLVIFISVIFSLKQETMAENVKLTTELFNSESNKLTKYFKDNFDMEIKAAANEIKNIDESLSNLKNIIDKII